MALFAARTPALARIPSDDWGHWTGILRHNVAASALPGDGVRPRQHPPAPPAPRLGMFLTSDEESGGSQLVFPNLMLLHRALHPVASNIAPPSIDIMETEADILGARGLLAFLGAALGLEPVLEGDCERYHTTLWALAVQPDAIPPSVCDVSAAVLTYRAEAWWPAEQAWQTRQNQLRAVNEAAKEVERLRLARTEKMAKVTPGDVFDAGNAAAQLPCSGSPKTLASPPSPSFSVDDRGGHRFGESGTINVVEDYSSFEEDGELWVWKRHRDGRTGRLFYVNSKTGDKQWHKPSRTVRSIRLEAAT